MSLRMSAAASRLTGCLNGRACRNSRGVKRALQERLRWWRNAPTVTYCHCEVHWPRNSHDRISAMPRQRACSC
eukprot:12361367-Alexandrium_andersonii.AAC.1